MSLSPFASVTSMASGTRSKLTGDKTRRTRPVKNRRGSPEAVEKRRAARAFNDVLTGRGATPSLLDGRTEKRRQRLIKELRENKARGTRELKPLDVLHRVSELLELGVPLGTIRKAAKPRKLAVEPTAVLEAVRRLHAAYGFRPEVYRFVGIGDDLLRAAGILAAKPTRRGRQPR
ncbi:MAG: hypothetical protein KDD47_02240 [Acidobacteria bacterium]|nr:hypothetical protein [Acidobacteriota bacterium]